AQFGGARTLGLVFEDSLLVAADLRGVSFRKQVLKHLNFSDADLGGCDFRDAVFEGGSLRHANLKNAQFAGADLRFVDISGMTLTTLAQFCQGSTVSADQAAALVSGLGVQVV
ncbi:pentapeptide repeat-containing protein, partial [Ideonella sp.]|uniref:pentapeptide repeat-containing protein n=1 Tax=Ideonella sp. TaxID=1929293 RepID=UPI003BB80D10